MCDLRTVISVTFRQSDGGVLRVDGVQDALIADLGLRDEADLAADVRRPATHVRVPLLVMA